MTSLARLITSDLEPKPKCDRCASNNHLPRARQNGAGLSNCPLPKPRLYYARTSNPESKRNRVQEEAGGPAQFVRGVVDGSQPFPLEPALVEMKSKGEQWGNRLAAG